MPFAPSDLTGLVAWHKADDLGLANGAAVATWTNSVGGGNDLTQPNAAGRPTYVTNSINGLAVVSFNGTSHAMVWPSGFDPASNNTIFILCQPGTTTPAGLLDSAPSSVNTCRNWPAGTWEWFNSQPAFSLNLPNANPVLLTFTASLTPSRQILYERNNVLISTNTNPSTTGMAWGTTLPPTIGAINHGAPRYAGTIGEYIIYNRVLSGTERTQVADYLTAKWLTAAPTAPTSLTATAVSSSAVNLSWTASTGSGITGYSVERCQGASCSAFSVVGTPTATSFSDTGLLAGTSYSYRVRATTATVSSSYSSTATAVTEAAPEPVSGVVVRSVSSVVTFAGEMLEDVLSARGQVSADGGWPTCSVFITAKPATGNEENELSVVAGAGNNVTRFTGKVRRFRPSAFPRGIEIVAMGTLAYAAEWAPGEDRLFDETFPSGTTDENLVAWALTSVPGVTYLEANIEGTGITLGTEAPEAFDWRAGVSAWAYIQALDQATLYRTYQQQDGTIRRVRMIGHPSGTTTNFTLAAEDILEGSTGERNTEQTRNAAIVRGHDYGDTLGPVLGAAYGANDFQGDGSTAATRHPELLSSDLIEDGNDEDGTPLGYGGIDAQDIADAVLDDVCKEFVQAQVRSWRDDTHGPGQTCLLDTLERLAIGEPMWVQSYAWEVSDGWSSTYTLSGGGLEDGYPAYTPPPV